MKTKVIDVADYILEQIGTVSAMKLQKLIYYAQSWHLVWQDEELFSEEIQAWANGPVIPVLYDKHRGQFKLEPGFFKGNVDNVSPKGKEVINKVLTFYADKNAQWLSDLTHMEDPWKLAREGLADGERGCSVISHASMAEYYGSI